MVPKLHNNGTGRLLFFKYLSPYYYTATAAAAAAAPQAHFLVAHLEKLLGFSKEEAIAATKKVTNWKSSAKDPNLVLNFFRKLGLDKSQIKRIVSRDPRLLLYDVNKTLEPKILVLQELGFSGSDLNKLIVNNRDVLSKGVDSAIRHPVEFLRKILGTDENVAKAVKKYNMLLNPSKQKNIHLNVEVLKRIDFSNENIIKFLLKDPRRFFRDPQWLVEEIHRVENECGISRESRMFYHGLDVISSMKRSTFDAKFEIYRCCGFTDEEVYRMFKIFPSVLGKSEAKVRETVDYIVGELGYPRDCLVSFPVLFGLSLEKRMKPRYEVLKILNEKKLINRKPGLGYLFYISESKFISIFLLPHKDEIPDVYQSYMKTVGSPKIGAL